MKGPFRHNLWHKRVCEGLKQSANKIGPICALPPRPARSLRHATGSRTRFATRSHIPHAIRAPQPGLARALCPVSMSSTQFEPCSLSRTWFASQSLVLHAVAPCSQRLARSSRLVAIITHMVCAMWLTLRIKRLARSASPIATRFVPCTRFTPTSLGYFGGVHTHRLLPT